MNMPTLARVVDNTLRGDGTIQSKVRVTAASQSQAKRQARRSSLLFNGYAPRLLTRQDSDISVNTLDVESEGLVGLRETFIVEVEIDATSMF